VPAQPLAFWFDFGSPYSYLAAMRVEGLAAARGVRVDWRPFLLGPVMAALGAPVSPFAAGGPKADYLWHDVARTCARRGLGWTRPSQFPRDAVLAHRVALHAADQPWAGDFCRAVMVRNFVEDREIGSRDAVAVVLASIGQAPDAVLDASTAPGLRARTDEARRLGVFGAPTFVVGGELFWGDDRLDDALVAAAG